MAKTPKKFHNWIEMHCADCGVTVQENKTGPFCPTAPIAAQTKPSAQELAKGYATEMAENLKRNAERKAEQVDAVRLLNDFLGEERCSLKTPRWFELRDEILNHLAISLKQEKTKENKKMTIKELAEKIVNHLWNQGLNKEQSVKNVSALIEEYGAELTDLRQVPTMPALGPLKQIIAAMEEEVSRFDTKGHPAVATIQKFANQLKKLVMLKQYTADVSGPAKCPRCGNTGLKFRYLYEKIANLDVEDVATFKAELLVLCRGKSCNYTWHIKQPNDMLQFFEQNSQNEKLHSEEAKIAFQKLSMSLGLDSESIGSWQNLVKAVNEKIVNLQGFETPKQTFARLAPEVPSNPPAADRAKIVAARLKELTKINELKGTVYQELFPLLIMLAEDLSEFKKSLDRLPGKSLPF